MSEGPKSALPRRMPAAAGAAVSHGLSIVARRSARARGHLDEGLLAVLEAALLQFDRQARIDAVRRMIAAGLEWDEIIDDYIPAAARRLGEMWCEDELGFADVTIGTARLQSMLRDMAPAWSTEQSGDPLAPNVILIVREDDYHTLGAMVAATQLRRLGLSVRLVLGLPDREVALLVAGKSFDAVLISASSSEKLDSVRDLVKNIREALVPPAPIVVGGTILETDRDVTAFTGADYATSDPQEVLRLCGLRISPLAGALSTGGA